MTFKELERMLLSNGWKYYEARGSHYYYIHNKIKGKITIPRHRWRCKKRNLKFNIKASGVKIALTCIAEEE